MNPRSLVDNSYEISQNMGLFTVYSMNPNAMILIETFEEKTGYTCEQIYLPHAHDLNGFKALPFLFRYLPDDQASQWQSTMHTKESAEKLIHNLNTEATATSLLINEEKGITLPQIKKFKELLLKKSDIVAEALESIQESYRESTEKLLEIKPHTQKTKNASFCTVL